MAKSVHLRLWWERLLLAASTGLLLWGPPVIAALIGLIAVAASEPVPHTSPGERLVPWLICGGLVSVALLVIQGYFEFQRRTYDPTWIFQFVKDFNDDDFVELRGIAATLLRGNPGKLSEPNLAFSDIDPVLDFFDSIGFYQHGGIISPEVVHQEFYYWLRGYYQAAHDYIETRRKDESPTWEYLPELFETLQEVEAKRAKSTFKKFLSKEKLSKFLQEEIATWETVKAKANGLDTVPRLGVK